MIKKIAVLRANALGDYIFVLPAMQALRETFPDTEIVLLGRGWHKQYVEDRPGPVDRVVVVPQYPGISEKEGFAPDPAVLEDFFNGMHNEQFDMAFQLHGGGRNSNPFLQRLGAKLTVGLKTPDAASLDINIPYVYYFNEYLRYLEVVARVGAKTVNLQPQVSVIQADLNEANDWLKNREGKPVAVIHPGASDVRRRWPGSNFACIADLLTEQGYFVCITGLQWERAVIDEVINNMIYKEQVHDLSGKLSLGGTTGLLSFADIIISNDTGPLHLARALERATVGIFWCANIINALPITTTLNRNLLSWTMNCPHCGLSSFKFNETHATCKHDTSMVAEVKVEDVKTTIEELLRIKYEYRQLFV